MKKNVSFAQIAAGVVVAGLAVGAGAVAYRNRDKIAEATKPLMQSATGLFAIAADAFLDGVTRTWRAVFAPRRVEQLAP